MLFGRADLVGLATMTLIGGLFFMLGFWDYRLSPSAVGPQMDRRFDTGVGDQKTVIDYSTKIIKNYGPSLFITNVQQKAPKKVSVADPMSAAKLVGVIEKEGRQRAIFLIKINGKEKQLFVGDKDELHDGWIVESINSTRVVLSKGNRSREYLIFR